MIVNHNFSITATKNSEDLEISGSHLGVLI